MWGQNAQVWLRGCVPEYYCLLRSFLALAVAWCLPWRPQWAWLWLGWQWVSVHNSCTSTAVSGSGSYWWYSWQLYYRGCGSYGRWKNISPIRSNSFSWWGGDLGSNVIVFTTAVWQATIVHRAKLILIAPIDFWQNSTILYCEKLRF